MVVIRRLASRLTSRLTSTVMGTAARAVMMVLTAALVLTGCTFGDDSGGTSTSATDGTSSAASDPHVLRVLAGSEVKDMEPVLAQVRKHTGVTLKMSYTGTLDGTQLVADGGAKGRYDATWFPSNRYLSLLPGGASALKREVKVMSSPVVLGVKDDVAQGLGWTRTPPTWSDIVAAVQAGKLRYAMTSPVSSNSGFSTLIEAATALSGTGDALQAGDVQAVSPALTTFAGGQALTAGSSGWLVDKVTANPTAVDGVFAYESLLTGVTLGGQKLDLIAPSDGVVTADYPLSLLASAGAAKGTAFDAVTRYLLTDAAQRQIATTTHRRTLTDGAPTTSTFETPFPNQLSTVRSLLDTYLARIKKPSDEVFTVDTSGSMNGDRLRDLKKALTSLTDTNTQQSSFVSFQPRESVTFVDFSDRVKHTSTVTISADDRAASLATIRRSISSLQADGGTAVYDALETAYGKALASKAANPDHFTSVTLFTDGENNTGDDYAAFARWYRHQSTANPAIRSIPAYVILFGEANTAELTDLATLTGGTTFPAGDATSLPSVFREIRGYQ